jgi:adenylosuccinate synthase
MGDLWNGAARLPSQLEEICGKYATFRTKEPIDEPGFCENFIKCCEAFANYVQPLGIGQCEDPVFEGAQGLLLDQNNKEFFPHVTHSNTGMTNVNILCQQAGITDKEIYYVSRTYLTRHGAGPLPGEDPNLHYEDNTNIKNQFQGALRFAPLDNKLKERIHKDAGGNKYKLVLTHCDQKSPPISADFYSDGPTRNDLRPA